MRIRMLADYRGNDHRHGTRFSGAGRAEHREILRQQFVDEHECRPPRIVIEGADAYICRGRPPINGRQIGFGHRSNGCSRNRVVRHAAAELGLTVCCDGDLPEQIDDAKAGRRSAVRLGLDRRDRSNDIERGAAHFDHRSDADRLLGELVGFEPHRHLRAGHRYDAPDAVHACHPVRSKRPSSAEHPRSTVEQHFIPI